VIYKLRYILGHGNFSKIIKRFIKRGYDPTILRNSSTILRNSSTLLQLNTTLTSFDYISDGPSGWTVLKHFGPE
jgi:hypothetical protein